MKPSVFTNRRQKLEGEEAAAERHKSEDRRSRRHNDGSCSAARQTGSRVQKKEI